MVLKNNNDIFDRPMKRHHDLCDLTCIHFRPNLLTVSFHLSMIASCVSVSSRLLTAPPGCLSLRGFCLYVSLLRLLDISHFNGIVCMCPVRRRIISEQRALYPSVPHVHSSFLVSSHHTIKGAFSYLTK